MADAPRLEDQITRTHDCILQYRKLPFPYTEMVVHLPVVVFPVL